MLTSDVGWHIREVVRGYKLQEGPCTDVMEREARVSGESFSRRVSSA